MIDEIVTVDEDVTEGNDLAIVTDTGGGLGVVLSKAPDGLADNLEISLDRLAEQAVISVFLDRLSPRGIANERRSVANILKQLG